MNYPFKQEIIVKCAQMASFSLVVCAWLQTPSHFQILHSLSLSIFLPFRVLLLLPHPNLQPFSSHWPLFYLSLHPGPTLSGCSSPLHASNTCSMCFYMALLEFISNNCSRCYDSSPAACWIRCLKLWEWILGIFTVTPSLQCKRAARR